MRSPVDGRREAASTTKAVRPREHASLCEQPLVLQCTTCKRWLMMPSPTNLDELHQVQCGACGQLMDVLGPPRSMANIEFLSDLDDSISDADIVYGEQENIKPQ